MDSVAGNAVSKDLGVEKAVSTGCVAMHFDASAQPGGVLRTFDAMAKSDFR